MIIFKKTDNKLKLIYQAETMPEGNKWALSKLKSNETIKLKRSFFLEKSHLANPQILEHDLKSEDEI